MNREEALRVISDLFHRYKTVELDYLTSYDLAEVEEVLGDMIDLYDAVKRAEGDS